MAVVSDEDRRVMQRQSWALAQVDRNEPGDECERRAAIERADHDRRAWGLPPLKTEVEFHRKAKERGLIRR